METSSVPHECALKVIYLATRQSAPFNVNLRSGVTSGRLARNLYFALNPVAVPCMSAWKVTFMWLASGSETTTPGELKLQYFPSSSDTEPLDGGEVDGLFSFEYI